MRSRSLVPRVPMYDTIVEPCAFTVFRPVLWMHWIVFVVIVLALILFEQFCCNIRR